MGTILIIVLSVAAAIMLAGLLYWYAFRYETGNFMLSKADIFIKREAYKNSNTAPVIQVDMDKANKRSNPLKEPFFTALHISDLHLRKDRNGEKLSKFVKSLGRLEADFIFITGDLVERNEYFDILLDMLSPLKAKIAKYAVFGVHDYYNKSAWEFTRNMLKKKKSYKRSNDTPELVSKLKEAGINVLQNEKINVELPFKKDGIQIGLEIAGIDDPVIEKADIDKVFIKEFENNSSYAEKIIELIPDLQKASQDKKPHLSVKQAFIPASRNEHVLNNPDKMLICLTHTPDRGLIAELSSNGADLIIAGHTHGGQVRLPGIGAIISGCNIKTKYASGLFYFKKFVLFISRGLGTGRYSPFRFYCQPEAVIINVYIT
jgi:predicted MPP superfamily phosphohydrolase